MSNICVDVSEFQPQILPWKAWFDFGVTRCVVRAGVGHRKDLFLTMHAKGAEADGLEVAFYWALLEGYDGTKSAQLFSGMVPWDDTLLSGGLPRYWVDVEGVGLDAADLTAFLVAWKQVRPNAKIGIYTSKYFWDGLIGLGHPEFAEHPLWVADYRTEKRYNPDIPDIWNSYVMHQFRYKAGYLPDYANDLDISEITVTTPQVRFGSKIGTHAINPGKTLPLAYQARDGGYRFPVMLTINDCSPLVDVKKIDPGVITICRYINTDEYESLQNVGSWSDDKIHQFAVYSIHFLLLRTPAAQLPYVDYWRLTNEANPRDELNGYTNYGKAMIELVKEADKHNLKLSLPAFPQGCPEWNMGPGAIGGGMVELCNTGLFGYMKRGGHILDVHEGVLGDQPITYGYGDIIPRAPYVFGAGSTCFRHRYLYHLLEQRDEVVPLVISEFYAGGGYPQDQSIASILKRFVWYDEIARTEPYLLGFLGFTIGPDSSWTNEDYTEFMISPDLDEYMRAQAQIPNVEVPMDVAKILTQATIARDAAQAVITEVQSDNTQVLYHAKVLQAVNVRDVNGNLTGSVLTVGTGVDVYATHITAGAYTDRAKINTNGNNVVMTSNGTPTLAPV